MEREPQLFEKVAAFLDALIEQHGVFVLFLSNEVREGATFDKAAALQTLAAMKQRRQAFIAPNEYLAPQQMMSLIAHCHATVSMRYHFCLFSALQRVPFVALQRSDKVVDLCTDLEWPFGAEMNTLKVADLVSLFEGVEGQHTDAIRQLGTRLTVMRERAAGNLAALEAVLNRGFAPSGCDPRRQVGPIDKYLHVRVD